MSEFNKTHVIQLQKTNNERPRILKSLKRKYKK